MVGKKISVFVIGCLGTIWVCLSLGCKKEPITIVMDGMVTNANSGTGIGGAHVVVSSENYGNASYGGDKKVLIDAYTGNDGVFSGEFERGKPIKYLVSITKVGYFPEEFEVQVDEWSTEDVNQTKFEVYSKAYVHVELVNEGTIDKDAITFLLNPGHGHDVNCCPTIVLKNSGSALKTDTVIATTGSQIISWQYQSISNGEEKTGSDIGFVGDSDTLHIKLVY